MPATPPPLVLEWYSVFYPLNEIKPSVVFQNVAASEEKSKPPADRVSLPSLILALQIVILPLSATLTCLVIGQRFVFSKDS